MQPRQDLESVNAQLPVVTATGQEVVFPWAPVPALSSLPRVALTLSILLAGLMSLRLLRPGL